jgi:hypothetical protein
MNLDWVKSVDSHNSTIINLESKYRQNAIISSVDYYDDKVYQKLDYRTNFSVDNEDVIDEVNKIVNILPTDSMNSLLLLDNEYFLIQYISKHIQQYKIQNDNIHKYIKLLTWISKSSNILANRLKLPKINKEFTGELVKRTYDFCPHRGNCQINYGNKKGKCCAPHYIHNLVQHDIVMTICYLEKCKNSTSFVLEQEIYKILKQINTIQFVINQMYLELSSFKNTNNKNDDIEKYHHNCKVEVVKNNVAKKFSFVDANVLDALDMNDSQENEIVSKRTNINTYRVWKE